MHWVSSCKNKTQRVVRTCRCSGSKESEDGWVEWWLTIGKQQWQGSFGGVAKGEVKRSFSTAGWSLYIWWWKGSGVGNPRTGRPIGGSDVVRRERPWPPGGVKILSGVHPVPLPSDAMVGLNDPVTYCGNGPAHFFFSKLFFPIFKLSQICKIQKLYLVCSKIHQTLHECSLNGSKQLSTWKQIQIPNIIWTKISGNKLTLILGWIY
jgi:hypothetical protein